jgi:hypothetical protein
MPVDRRGRALIGFRRLLGVAAASQTGCLSAVGSRGLPRSAFDRGVCSPAPMPRGRIAVNDLAVRRRNSASVERARRRRPEWKPFAGASVRLQYNHRRRQPPRCPIGDCEVLADPYAGRIPVYRVTTAAGWQLRCARIKARELTTWPAVAHLVQSERYSDKHRTTCPAACACERRQSATAIKFGSNLRGR